MADQSESSQNIEGTVVISNVVGGTITKVNAGSIVVTAGTLITGTLGLVDQFDRQHPKQVTSFGTLGTAGGSLFGTISGTSGGGTIHVVSGLSVVVNTGTADIRILIGSAIIGGSVLSGGAFPPGGGIARTFDPPIDSGTNSELIYHFVGAGTAFITVQYWKTT